ncbi:MAG TPA: YciI family protein [Chthoniobacterales bacterium]|jgi:hypothetical protein|nr:YciI family protein [Chthoniobacterales bacterium]
MSEQASTAEYLVISRGQWDKTLSQDEIQSATEKFYIWYDRLINEGKMKPGQRLTSEGKTVGRKDVITDGPFGESKEVIGGYWFILAHSLDEAAQIAKGNPCLDCGLLLEIRPIAPQCATPDNTR